MDINKNDKQSHTQVDKSTVSTIVKYKQNLKS
jgi:hypothetical protein